MANIQFNEPQYARSVLPAAKPSALSSVVITLGLAKDEAGAQKTLWGILVIVVLLIIWVNW